MPSNRTNKAWVFGKDTKDKARFAKRFEKALLAEDEAIKAAVCGNEVVKKEFNGESKDEENENEYIERGSGGIDLQAQIAKNVRETFGKQGDELLERVKKRERALQKSRPINSYLEKNKKKKKRIAPTLQSGRHEPIDHNAVQNRYLSQRDITSFLDLTNVSFDESNVVLNPAEVKTAPSTNGLSNKVTVTNSLAKVLKPHQVDGVKFMWDNVCESVSALRKNPPRRMANRNASPESEHDKKPQVQGCILAHNMGLGKSLQVVVLLHSLLTHPSMIEETSSVIPRRVNIFRRALLIVPVNTLANWEDEFEIWLGPRNTIPIHFANKFERGAKRTKAVKKWLSQGGVLLVSFSMFRSLSKKAGEDGASSLLSYALQSPGPDIVVVDEAHQCLKNSSTGISKMLYSMQTSRRIALTGTPFQNCLAEYYCMANWVRPGCLSTEAEFERNFIMPIMNGIRADSTAEEIELQVKQTSALYNILLPFVHRKDSKILKKELPFMQQAVLVVRQSKLQSKLYRAYKKYQEATNTNNFLEACGKLRPVFNHPGCLLQSRSLSPPLAEGEFWNSSFDKGDESAMRNGNSPPIPVGETCPPPSTAIHENPVRNAQSESLRVVTQNVSISQQQCELGLSSNRAGKHTASNPPQPPYYMDPRMLKNLPFTNNQSMKAPLAYCTDPRRISLPQAPFSQPRLSSYNRMMPPVQLPHMQETLPLPVNRTNPRMMPFTHSSHTQLAPLQPPSMVPHSSSFHTQPKPFNSRSSVDSHKMPLTHPPNTQSTLIPSTNGVKSSSPLYSQTGSKNITFENGQSWWQTTYKKYPDMADLKHGGKMVLLLQILAHADLIGDKVVVFSQCLKTLDYIETVLNMSKWEEKDPKIAALSPGKTWGPWRKNVEYLRIDGGTAAASRGEMITSFNEEQIDMSFIPNPRQENKVFLLSTKAGGVGINLTAANRVIIFDSHWNPALDLQALYRCYRYGQKKPVFAYRLLAEGTMEEKIYSRQVNKTSLSARVIDQTNPARCFTQSELTNLMNNDTWVQCDSCDKWRMLPAEADVENLPERWFCYMNVHDKDRSSCSAEEKDQGWYVDFFSKRYAAKAEGHAISMVGLGDVRSSIGRDNKDKEAHTKRDVVLGLMLPSAEKKSKTWISKYHFHDALLEDVDDEAVGFDSADIGEAKEKGQQHATEDCKVKNDNFENGSSLSSAPDLNRSSINNLSSAPLLCDAKKQMPYSLNNDINKHDGKESASSNNTDIKEPARNQTINIINTTSVTSKERTSNDESSTVGRNSYDSDSQKSSKAEEQTEQPQTVITDYEENNAQSVDEENRSQILSSKLTKKASLERRYPRRSPRGNRYPKRRITRAKEPKTKPKKRLRKRSKL